MDLKTFVVSTPRAKTPLTIRGRSLKDALKRERLNPAFWKVIPSGQKEVAVSNGED